MINRRNEEFPDEDITQITDIYHAWRNIGAGSEPAPYDYDVLRHPRLLQSGNN